MIRVLIVDDQPVVRQGFELFLAGNSTIEVVGHASSGRHAVQQVSALQPDVVLMDIRMPNGDGLTATREILARFDDVRVIVVTTFDLDEYVFAALDSGASGFLLKDADPDELIDVSSDSEGPLQEDGQVPVSDGTLEKASILSLEGIHRLRSGVGESRYVTRQLCV